MSNVSSFSAWKVWRQTLLQLKAMVTTDAEKKMLVELAQQAGSDDVEAWKVDALRALAETAAV